MMKCKALMAVMGVSFVACPAAAQDVVDAGSIIPEDWDYEALFSFAAAQNCPEPVRF